MAYEKPADELGTLWRNETRSGKINWKGEIDGIGKVICWENTVKGDKKLLRVMRYKPREDGVGDQVPF